MRISSLLIASLILCGVGVFADPITYDVRVNTSTVAGTLGSLEFQFNPGPLVSQAASLQIFGFSGDGTLGTSAITGDVVGALPNTVAFDNGTAFNDYFTGFTFGTLITFTFKIDGPAVTSPDHISTSGSTFAFSMYSDSAGTVPTLTTDLTNGFATIIEVNLDGSTTVETSSAETTIATTSVPEANSAALVGASVFLLAIGGRRRRYAHHGKMETNQFVV